MAGTELEVGFVEEQMEVLSTSLYRAMNATCLPLPRFAFPCNKKSDHLFLHYRNNGCYQEYAERAESLDDRQSWCGSRSLPLHPGILLRIRLAQAVAEGGAQGRDFGIED